jgi:imidazole glycerol phosphate synthase glutamine amidotransferase subunit
VSGLVVVRTGAANLASVLAAFRRLGAAAEVTEDARRVAAAERVVLPGVGAFAPVAERLHRNGLGDAVRDRVEEGRPTLAVCLGLHLLGLESEEGGKARGLGVLPVRASRFPDGVVAPQLGWNRVRVGAGARLLRDGTAYFANSYRLTEAPEGWVAAFSDHGGPFIAALERGPVLACQFHPELSGPWGQDLIERWLEVEPC